MSAPVEANAGSRTAGSRWAEIDTAALRHNARRIVEWVGPDVAMMAMVKANGYGHGMEIAAQAFLDGGAKWLGVCCAAEAIRLRRAGFAVPILVTGWVEPESLSTCIEAEVQMAVYDVAHLQQIAAACVGDKPARVHVKLDSGMHRLGTLPEGVDALLAALKQQTGRVEIAGVFTHFADAEGRDPEFTQRQHAALQRLVPRIKELAPGALVHCCNSAATLRHAEMHHEMVRPGIALYGYPPLPNSLQLRPAMSVLGLVSQVKVIAPGETVGYGRTWTARRPTPIAVVMLGYADGVSRLLSNRGEMLLGGRRCPIVGRISMDLLTVDISDTEGVAAGDEAVFIGPRGDDFIGAGEVADKIGTIAYEVLCGVGERVPRIPV